MWLKVLNDSKRKSSLGPSPFVNGIDLNRAMFQFCMPGPLIASLGALPKPWLGPPAHGATGSANELVENHALIVFGYATFDTRLGRFEVPPPNPRTSLPEYAARSGKPFSKNEMPETVQPPSVMRARVFELCVNHGRLYT